MFRFDLIHMYIGSTIESPTIRFIAGSSLSKLDSTELILLVSWSCHRTKS